MKSVNYFHEVDHVLVRMCKFQRQSSKRMRQLQHVSEALGCELFKISVPTCCSVGCYQSSYPLVLSVH
jgi:hypothetical protein